MQCVDSRALGYLAVVYSVLFIVIGSLVMLNLFIGVITAEMDAAIEAQKGRKAIQVRLDQLCRVEKIGDEAKEAILGLGEASGHNRTQRNAVYVGKRFRHAT